MSLTWSAASFVVGGVLCGAALVLTGCASPLPSSGPVAVYPRPDSGMDAALEGVLRADDDCVAVSTHDSAVVPQFPAGDASWRDGVLTWRGGEYRDGDAISLGGGMGGEDGLDRGYWPDGCRGLVSFTVSPY
ncbi:dihydrolipoamide dehydrogenase [Microbacterium soli]|uniref:Uncharacterized protein n=1 Tax=Microbacterium soli TaxID=446075 RepID=A0ABP7MW00_9MICO